MFVQQNAKIYNANDRLERPVTRQEMVACGLIRTIRCRLEARQVRGVSVACAGWVPYIAVGPEAVAAAAARSIRQPLGDQLRQEVIGRMSSETLQKPCSADYCERQRTRPRDHRCSGNIDCPGICVVCRAPFIPAGRDRSVDSSPRSL